MMITKLLRLIIVLSVVVITALVVPWHAGTTQSDTLRPVTLSHSNVLYAQRLRAHSELARARRKITVDSQPTTASVPTPTPPSTPTPTPTTSTPSPPAPVLPAPDPGTAQAIAYGLLPSYGFNQTTEFTCLVNLWDRESGWRWNAEEPTSGAYGIPQSLPASKMAMFGSDYLTNPTTQEKWGLWYIKAVYGDPCSAWDHDTGAGWY